MRSKTVDEGFAMDSGSTATTFTSGQANSPAIVVPHNLGKVPKRIVATVKFAGSDPDNIPSVVAPSTYTRETFTAICRRSANAPSTYAVTFDWVAYG